jgi:uncharacterized membrane protein YjgN (DUF898 family)
LKSTINKSYEKNALPNGDVEISYKYNSVAKNFAVLIGCFFALMPMMSEDIVVIALDFLLIASFIFMYIKSWRFTEKSIIVVPNVGLKFNSQQIPLSEINSIGCNGNSEVGYVYATSNGTKIDITPRLHRSLAEAIKKEIMQLSGAIWS